MTVQASPQTATGGVLPDDPSGFVAEVERATNSGAPGWVIEQYADSIRFELVGDGVRDVYDGIEAAGAAATHNYHWFGSIGARINKRLLVAGGGRLVLEWDGTLFRGRQRTYGVELWEFDQTGKATRNALFSALNPRSSQHPIAALRMLFGHPRASFSYLLAGSGSAS